jgi:CBS domain-containing protein
VKIRKIMSRSTHAVGPGTSIAEAADQMLRFDIGAVPVVEHDKVVGIVTDRDIVVRAVARSISREEPVCAIMSFPVLACDPEDDLDSVVDRMRAEQIRRMPVCSEHGHLLGMMSLGDAARYDPDKEEVAGAISDISRPFGRHCQTHASA